MLNIILNFLNLKTSISIETN